MFRFIRSTALVMAACLLSGLMLQGCASYKTDYKAAVREYRKGAEQGDAVAQYRLGNMYRTGLGVPQDYAEAVRWYRRAADQGLAEAQLNLGNRYMFGQGVPQDFGKAHMWHSLIVAQGKNFNTRSLKGKATRTQLQEAEWLALRWIEKHRNPPHGGTFSPRLVRKHFFFHKRYARK